MAKHRVTQVYAAFRDGVHYGPWTPGEEVELTDELAEWVNRDAPGTLIPVQSEPEKPVEREAKPAPDRAHKGTRKTR